MVRQAGDVDRRHGPLEGGERGAVEPATLGRRDGLEHSEAGELVAELDAVAAGPQHPGAPHASTPPAASPASSSSNHSSMRSGTTAEASRARRASPGRWRRAASTASATERGKLNASGGQRLGDEERVAAGEAEQLVEVDPRLVGQLGRARPR